jgi:hypothetical protein
VTRSAIVACLLVAACGGGGGDDVAPAPRVDLIDDAIAAVEAYYGEPQEYFEISADLASVGFVVAVDDATMAEQGSYTVDGGLAAPQAVGEASGVTFSFDLVTFDEDAIFDRLAVELDDPVIVDFAIQGAAGDTVAYDATIASDNGGILLVLLGADGEILGVQGR